MSARELAGVLDWWREAGVDCSFEDAADGWLEAPEEVAAKPPPPPPQAKVPPRTTPLQRALATGERPTIGGAPGDWPQDLAGFRDFWLSEPTLAEGALSARVAPRGEAGAGLMVLVSQPEDADRDRLLDGPQGALLANFARAAGLADDDLYVASALPRATPLPDWSDLATRGLGAVVRHHIGLVKPGRLLVFGRGLMPLLAEGDTPPAHLDLGKIQVPLHCAPRLDRLLRMPGHRKLFWTNWLEWTA